MENKYCVECGNNEEFCTCSRCDICKKYFGQHYLYDRNGLKVCESCIDKDYIFSI